MNSLEQVDEQVNEEVTELSTEERARAMGWVDKDEFKGDPDRHIGAEKYVERAESKLPLLQKTLNDMTQKYAKLEQDFTQVQEASMEALKAQKQQIMDDLKRKQREAVENGDTEQWERLETEKEEMVKPKPQPQAQPALSREDQLSYMKFQRDNKWYTDDPYLRTAAGFEFEEINRVMPQAPFTQKLQMVEQRVREKYADEMPQTQTKSRLPKVEAGGGRVMQAAQKTYADLPDSAKKACDAFVRRKTMTQEDYVKQYFSYDD